MRFSERMGHVEPRSVIQIDDMDEPLRNSLWNLIYLRIGMPDMGINELRYEPDYVHFARLWIHFFQRPIDQIPLYRSSLIEEIRAHFYRRPWYEAYDLLEFFYEEFYEESNRDRVAHEINSVLATFLSGYRLVGGIFTPITNDEEIASIEYALAKADRNAVSLHLTKALGLLRNGGNPDPANSIKESVSAIEALASTIAGRKATLSEALKTLRGSGVQIHSALEQGWIKLYGYTSDAGGIRHALTSDTGPTVAEAQYFLVSASAFINLLTSLATDAGVKLAGAPATEHPGLAE